MKATNPSTILYLVVRSRDYDEGLVPVPVASARGRTAHIRVGAPQELLRIDWEVRRDGAPPIAPSPRSLDANNVFLRGSQSAAVPIHNHDGRQQWSMSGHYLYSLVAPKGLEAPMPTGRAPWDKTAASSNTVPASNFQTGLVGDGIMQGMVKSPTPLNILQGITNTGP